jgi:hypothetical protein
VQESVGDGVVRGLPDGSCISRVIAGRSFHIWDVGFRRGRQAFLQVGGHERLPKLQASKADCQSNAARFS